MPNLLSRAMIPALALTLLALPASQAAAAEPTSFQTPSPVIYLADNLDEADNLGWCIDTLGRGFAETLQTHSCKPQGGDVQFSFDSETGQIRSVAFDGKCMELSAPDNATVPFGLLDCVADNAAQVFTFNAETGQIHPAERPEKCVAAGEASRSAGPFMSRDLILADCSAIAPELTTWIVKE